MKKRVIFLAAAALVLAGALSLRGNQKPPPAPRVEEVYKYVSSDYPVYADIQQMYEKADYIVIGQYTDFVSTWNMDRNPQNPAEEDPNSYSEGRLYSFAVDRVLKGGSLPDEITVNKYYSFASGYSTYDAAGEELYIPCQIPTQYFVESEYGVDYLLFLNYNEMADNYYSIGEPWEMMVQPDGTMELKSNLFNPPAGMPATLETEVRTDDVVYKIIVGGTDIGRYEDFLSGMSLDAMEAAIQASAVDAAPAA